MPLARHDGNVWNVKQKEQVSTHMPLARHDGLNIGQARLVLVFLLTCLLRGMTINQLDAGRICIVSTHMPLARHDGAS